MPAEIYLRFRTDDGTGKVWLRRGLFSMAWSRTLLIQLASPFESREKALAFVAQFKLAGDVDLITMTREELRRG